MKKRYQPLLLLLLLLGVVGWNQSANAQLVVDCFPYVTDFDDQGGCSNSCGVACPLTNGWTQGVDDTQDWTVWSGGTTSGSTGPSGDHTTGSGNYIYLETSGGCSGFDDSAHVETPIIDATGISNLSMIFWRHLFGATIDNLHIDSRTIVGGVPSPWAPDLVPPYTGNLDQWLADTLNLASFVGSQFQLRFRATSGNSFTGDIAIDDVSFITLNTLDAAVLGFTSPVNPINVGSNTFAVDVVNLGLTPLTSFNVNWQVNNGMIMTQPFAGVLAPGAITNVFLGTANLPVGNSTARAWVSDPNGSTDLQPCNDTTFASFCTPYAGTFAVGAGQAFTTPDEAADAIVECGISGPVTFNIIGGTYGPITFAAPVPGASAANTITFNGGDTSLVTIASNGGNTVELIGTDYVTIKNVTIQNTGAATSAGVMLNDSADWNHIDSCRIEMIVTTISTVAGVVSSSDPSTVFSAGRNAWNCTVSNSTINGGYYGVRFNGISTAQPYDVGNSIIDNEFDDQYVYPIYVSAQDSLDVIGNIVNAPDATFGDGIYLLDISNFHIEENVVLEIPDWGIYISDGNFGNNPSTQSTIINNFVSSLTDYALYTDDTEETNIYHNTCYGNIGYYSNDIVNVNVVNNIFAGTLYAAYTLDDLNTMVNVLFDYNVYWNDGGGVLFRNGANNYADLLALQTGSGTNNQASVEGDPLFVNGKADLHVRGAIANDAGDNSVGITIDADGDARPASGSTTVDIGADEYTPNTTDAVGIAIISPAGTVCGDSLTPIEIVIGNLGVNPFTNLPIVIEVTGDINQTINYTYSDTLLFGNNDTVIAGFLNTYNGGNISITGYTALTGDQDASNDTLLGSFNISFIPFVPGGFSGYGCGSDSVDIFGDQIPGVSYEWYANLTDTIPVGIGSSYTIPSVTTQPTYFVQYGGVADSLFTTNAAGNGSNGNMFDIEAFQDVTITGFSMFLNATTHANIEIWAYTSGSHVGNEGSNAGWTLLGSVQNFTVGTAGIYYIPTSFNQFIAAGSTMGFYVATDGGNSYTNGTTVGGLLAQNSIFRVNEGVGKGTPFFTGSTFSPRNFNGYVHFGNEPCSDERAPVTGIQGVGAVANLGADTATCGSTPVILDATNGATLDYDWSTGDSIASIVVTMTGQYFVDVTDTNGCEASDTINVAINADPTVDLGPDTTICNGTLAALDAGNPGSTYFWNTSDTSQTIAVGGGAYAVTVTDANGCMGDDNITISVQTNNVDLGVDTTLCDGAALNLDAGSAVTYAWSTSDTTQTINVSTAGTYSVTTTDNLGCLGVDDITVATETTPTSAFSFSVDGTGLVFDFTYTGTANATSFDWDFGDSNTDTGQDPTHTYAADGNYTVTLIVTNVCGSDTITQNLDVVGIEDGLRAESISIFPNPNNGTFTYSFTNYDLSDVTVEMFTVTGQQVYGKLYEQVSGTIDEKVSINDISRGMYFLRFTSGSKIITRRVTID